jgi:hypothetical protein
MHRENPADARRVALAHIVDPDREENRKALLAGAARGASGKTSHDSIGPSYMK